jgi:glutaminase
VLQAIEGKLAVPKWEEFTHRIEALYDSIRDVKGGANATYIPILAEADPDWFGISVCTVDGQRFDIGDTHIDFSIQSCVKPLVYAVAIEDIGLERVHRHVPWALSPAAWRSTRCRSMTMVCRTTPW